MKQARPIRRRSGIVSGWSSAGVATLVLVLAGCGGPDAPPPGAESTRTAPADEQHAGITEPHGDHTPHHGGMVLMNGDVHYEVVVTPEGRYELWFSDAVRTELPASIASNVRVEVTRPEGPVESVALALDEAGESWVGQGRPVSGSGIFVKVSYDLRGVPSEVEIPVVPQETS